MAKNPKFIIDCADHSGFVRLANGQKKVLTRVNKTTNWKDDYSESAPGDILELVDTKTKEKILAEVIAVQRFDSISELYNTSKVAEETFNKTFLSEQELRGEYEKNRPGYTQLIDRYGLIVWRIRRINFGKK